MPALPHAMADLPPRPTTTMYDQDAHYRDHVTTRQRSSQTSTRSDGTYGTSSNTHNKGYSDRQARYARSSYHANGSSSSMNSASGFSTSNGQPSPSSSATSTASSLRTPPDLLLNGSSLPIGLPAPFAGYKGMTRVNGKERESEVKRPVHLTVDQLELRLQLLSDLPGKPLSGDLPTPPSSPKPATLDAPLSLNKKRKVSDNSDKSEEESSAQASKRRQSMREAIRVNDNPSVALQAIESISWELPTRRDWSKELYFETAVAYRHRGRQLKHRGDDRRRELSTNKRLASFADKEKESLAASLEQMDALLLYVYGFWCEDQACGGSCVVANWTSLYGLLKYVYEQLNKSKMTVLAGMCRLVEATVRRHVANHEMRMVHHRLNKSVAMSSNVTTAQSPVSGAAPSPSSSDSTQQTLAEVSETMTKIVADNERSSRLIQQARQSILNLFVLRETYPSIAELCDGCTKNRVWNSTDPNSLATLVDPSAGLKGGSESPLAVSANGWVWPLDLGTPFPLIVNFGRAVLREAAREARVPFIMEPVQPS